MVPPVREEGRQNASVHSGRQSTALLVSVVHFVLERAVNSWPSIVQVLLGADHQVHQRFLLIHALVFAATRVASSVYQEL